MIKNSIYSSSPQVFTALIENPEGLVMFTKKLDDWESSLAWSQGMTDEGHAYKITDSDTKRILASARKLKGEFVSYEIPAEKEPELTMVGAAPLISKGVKTELEHRDLIVKFLTGAGQEVTEAKIMSIAAEIARVHEKEDPHYYEKLERVGL